jgi:hypothetical protein
MFLDHTQRRTTFGRIPLDEWSARRRDLYLTTHETHNRQISMPPVGFEPTISVGERPQVRIPPGAWVFVCCECRVLSGRSLCDELITHPEESYRLCCVVVTAGRSPAETFDLLLINIFDSMISVILPCTKWKMLNSDSCFHKWPTHILQLLYILSFLFLFFSR